MMQEGEERVGTNVVTFAEKILHGDQEHREWLLESAVAFARGEPIPEIRGGKLSEEQVQEQFKQLWREGNPFFEAARTATDERLSELKHRVRALEKHQDLCLKGLRFVVEIWNSGLDMDEFEMQDKLEELGLLIREDFDPARHEGAGSEYMEPGDPWYMISPDVLVVLKSQEESQEAERV